MSTVINLSRSFLAFWVSPECRVFFVRDYASLPPLFCFSVLDRCLVCFSRLIETTPVGRRARFDLSALSGTFCVLVSFDPLTNFDIIDVSLHSFGTLFNFLLMSTKRVRYGIFLVRTLPAMFPFPFLIITNFLWDHCLPLDWPLPSL